MKTCRETLKIENVGANAQRGRLTFRCDLEPDHETQDEGMHSFTAVTGEPPVEYNVLWGAVEWPSEISA